MQTAQDCFHKTVMYGERCESFRKTVFRETWVWWVSQSSIIKARKFTKSGSKVLQIRICMGKMENYTNLLKRFFEMILS